MLCLMYLTRGRSGRSSASLLSRMEPAELKGPKQSENCCPSGWPSSQGRKSPSPRHLADFCNKFKATTWPDAWTEKRLARTGVVVVHGRRRAQLASVTSRSDSKRLPNSAHASIFPQESQRLDVKRSLEQLVHKVTGIALLALQRSVVYMYEKPRSKVSGYATNDGDDGCFCIDRLMPSIA
jgi:hypothetical protein